MEPSNIGLSEKGQKEVLSRRWYLLSEDDKAQYVELAAQDRARHERELQGCARSRPRLGRRCACAARVPRRLPHPTTQTKGNSRGKPSCMPAC